MPSQEQPQNRKTSKSTHSAKLPAELSSRYEVVKELGAGGQGRAVQLRDIATGKTEWVAKITDLHDSWDAIDRFKDEVTLLRKLDHPGIVKIREGFVDWQSKPPRSILIQEFVEGESWQDRLATTPMPLDDLYTYALSLIDVLAYLRSFEPAIIHRDIKPSNIILRGHGQLTLIDFDIANTVATQTGMTMAGTIGYAPPEQLMGYTTTASDVYAVAATLLHALTGTPPYRMASDPHELDLKNLRQMHLVRSLHYSATC